MLHPKSAQACHLINQLTKKRQKAKPPLIFPACIIAGYPNNSLDPSLPDIFNVHEKIGGAGYPKSRATRRQTLAKWRRDCRAATPLITNLLVVYGVSNVAV